MKRVSKLRVAAAVLAALVLALVVVAMGLENWKRDLTTNVATTDAAAQDRRMRPLKTISDGEHVREALVGLVMSEDQWELPKTTKPLPVKSRLRSIIDPPLPDNITHVVHKTRVMGFRDDVWVVIEPRSGGGSRVHVHSQSRIGVGDFGQNPRNIRDLLAGLRQRLEDF